MIKAILIDKQLEDLRLLEKKIDECFPNVKIRGKASSMKSALKLIKHEMPNLIFFDINLPEESIMDTLEMLPAFDIEAVIVTHLAGYEEEAIKYNVCGYIPKPVRKSDLVLAMENVHKRILLKEENKNNKRLIQNILRQLSGNDLIGIPTLEGFDFYAVAEIVRCEGMQRCTRIITKTKSNIISSYNLGEFRKLLEPYGFFSPHKSHLINLDYVKRYKREGEVTLIDNFPIPVARNKKRDFLRCMNHL